MAGGSQWGRLTGVSRAAGVRHALRQGLEGAELAQQGGEPLLGAAKLEVVDGPRHEGGVGQVARLLQVQLPGVDVEHDVAAGAQVAAHEPLGHRQRQRPQVEATTEGHLHAAQQRHGRGNLHQARRERVRVHRRVRDAIEVVLRREDAGVHLEARGLQALHRPERGAGDGPARGAVGRHRGAADVLELLASRADGGLEGVRLLVVDEPVIHPVQADVVSRGHRAPHHLRVAAGAVHEEEEGGARPVLLEQLQQPLHGRSDARGRIRHVREVGGPVLDVDGEEGPSGPGRGARRYRS